MENQESLANQYENEFIRNIHLFIRDNFPDGLVLISQIFVKALLLFAFFMIMYIALRKILLPIVKKIIKKSNYEWDDILLKHRVFHSIVKVIPIFICYQLVPYVFYNHPLSFQYFDKVFFIIFLLLFFQFLFRLLDSLANLSNVDGNYTSVAVRSFVQITKILSIILGVFILIFTLFDISIAQILTIIGAITAVVVLVFRDPILGFVTGLHVSTSKLVKVGDWVTIPKYNLEGNIQEINLITTKVENLDKVISSVPTYDLISTEIRNNEPMREGERRRIKRSIIFSIKSFKFVEEELEKKLEKIELLQSYLIKTKEEIRLHNDEVERTGKGTKSKRQLTNIGVFRKYVIKYLRQNPNINNEEILMVRQLEIKPQGLPLEVYCFTNVADWIIFEEIQADIFDHLLTIAKEFDLEIVQTLTA